jgi:hypothetical protein
MLNILRFFNVLFFYPIYLREISVYLKQWIKLQFSPDRLIRLH